MKRLTAIDSARGLAMLFMLINHGVWRIPTIHFGANYGWNIPAPVATYNAVGWVNLLQGSPIFMLCTGFGVALFEQARKRKGWTDEQITRYFLIRGGVIILLDMLVVPWVIQYPVMRWESKFLVLTSIGICLWMLAILRRVPPHRLLIFAGILLLGCQVIYHLATPQESNLLRSLMLYPAPTDPIGVGFPVLAWLPVVILGYCSGRHIIEHPERLTQHCLRMGSAGLLLWGIVTLNDGFGRLYHGHVLILAKHPPDLTYMGFNVGMAYLILAMLHKLPTVHLLATLGQSALSFYVIHWYVLMVVTGLLSNALRGWGLYVGVCLLALLILYPLCVHYREIRSHHPRILQYL